MNNFAWAIIGIIAIFAIIAWAETRDRWIMEASSKYEECVRAEYGVSPAHWYAEKGEYPPCPITAQ